MKLDFRSLQDVLGQVQGENSILANEADDILLGPTDELNIWTIAVLGNLVLFPAHAVVLEDRLLQELNEVQDLP